ncbi:hypothetical protein [Curtobacterium sp. MCBA15_001]|uniref:hypothetical protein n=1 Tax=Curtobacterium sp. MCBA15_001 TaxID=1898731 RepID=UPI0008DDBB50|nr:hypothetical protein [Curtobacterium sp. MCBA15_001]OIH95393.1 hypothetical protein BIU90_01425 [Curtobacterium sp. MCBA15_001]
MRAEGLRRSLLTGVAAAGLVAALAGCSGAAPTDVAVTPTATGFGGQVPVSGAQNGIETVDGRTALDDVLAAMRSEPVVVTGTVTELVPDPAAAPGAGDTVPGRTVRIDWRGTPTDSRLQLTVGDVTVDARRRADDVWVTGNAAFVARSGLAQAARGRVCVAATSAAIRDLAPFTEPDDLLRSLLGTGSDVTLHPGAVTGSGSASRVQIVVADGSSPVGTLEVSAVGAPVPYAFRASDSTGTVDLTFTDWGKAQELGEPDRVVSPC